jgi:hypothetical protein
MIGQHRNGFSVHPEAENCDVYQMVRTASALNETSPRYPKLYIKFYPRKPKGKNDSTVYIKIRRNYVEFSKGI